MGFESQLLPRPSEQTLPSTCLWLSTAALGLSKPVRQPGNIKKNVVLLGLLLARLAFPEMILILRLLTLMLDTLL